MHAMIATLDIFPFDFRCALIEFDRYSQVVDGLAEMIVDFASGLE